MLTLSLQRLREGLKNKQKCYIYGIFKKPLTLARALNHNPKWVLPLTNINVENINLAKNQKKNGSDGHKLKIVVDSK